MAQDADMSEPIPLEQWSVAFTDVDDPFLAPELRPVVLVGLNPEGEKVVELKESVIVNGRNVTMMSGAVYRLGEPEPGYRRWLHEHRPNWDPENPLSPS